MEIPLVADQNTFIVVVIIGVIVCFVIPTLVNLKVFVLSETFSEFKIMIEKEFARKESVEHMAKGMEKKFDHIEEKMDHIYEKLEDIHKGMNKKK
jgi:membrane-associated HD superfamily phosphohydrolase